MAYLATTHRQLPRTRRSAQLGDLGLQIGPRIRIGGTVGKVGQNAKKAVTKAVVDTGHTVGKVATNKYVIGAEAALLAATGAGAVPAAALLAAQKGAANLIKPGGNLKSAATGAVQGAVVGTAAALAPSILRATGKTAIGAGKLVKSEAVSIGSRIKRNLLPPTATDTGSSSTGQRRRITNGDASAVVDAKNRDRKSKTGGKSGILEQLLSQISQVAAPPQATTTPQVYTAPVMDGPIPGDQPAIQQASLLGNPLVLAGGAIALILLAKPHGSAK